MRKLCILAAALLLTPLPAPAEIMPPVYDSELLSCDLIIVARIERQTLKRFDDHADAKLIVRDTLRGVAPGEIMDARINTIVLVDGQYKGTNTSVNMGGQAKPRADGPITLYGRYDDWADRNAPDLARDAIWFLRKSKDGLSYYVPRCEHTQPLKYLPYFLALLSADADAAVDKLLKTSDKDVRIRVLKYLTELHRPRDAPRIAACLADADEQVQATAAGALAEVGDASAVPLMRKALAHAGGEVRAAACRFLCRFRDAESIDAVGKAMATLEPAQAQRVAEDLWRMESRRAVPILLELLDERVLAGRQAEATAYYVSVKAAESLNEITGATWPLDSGAARKLWEKLQASPDEVLIRKRILAEIENLTHADHQVRWSAYRFLSRVVNRHFGSGDAFHHTADDDARRESQKLWRGWAAENLTKSRLDWIHAGFAAAGIDLSRPMTTEGIDTLVEVLMYYRGQGERAGRANWKRGGWPQSDAFAYNVNLLLERHTGHKVGLSPYHHDLMMTWRQREVLERRWEDWWKLHRGKVELKPWPAEREVSREMLDKAPGLQAPPAPLELTIRMSKDAYAKGEPVVVHVQVKNVSAAPLTIARRPLQLQYGSATGSGSAGYSRDVGLKAGDFVTLKPREVLEWDDDRAVFRGYTEPHKVEGFHYRATWPMAGSQFGQRAWRGEALSNSVAYALTN